MTYLKFEDISNATPYNKRKTKTINVHSLSTGLKLARIEWYSHWRQYTFMPEEGTVWNPECLKEINAKIDDLMKQRRN